MSFNLVQSRSGSLLSSAKLGRRHLLQVGGLGLMGLSLPKLLEAREAAPVKELAAKADHCIVLFLNGGPSHLDMWDMKPDAADGIRGEFQPIATSLPGYQVSEHLPQLARHMHRATVVRSMHHSVNNAHAAAVYAALTGHDRGEIGGGTRPTDYPSPGVRAVDAPSAGTADRAARCICRTSRRRVPAVRRSRASSGGFLAARTTRCSCSTIPTRPTSRCRS